MIFFKIAFWKPFFLTPWPTYATNWNTLNIFGRWPPRDYFCDVWSESNEQFQRRCLSKKRWRTTGGELKTEQGLDTVLVHCTKSHWRKHAYQTWSHEPMVKKWCSGQEICSIKSIKGEQLKTEQGRVTVFVHCTLSHCQKHAYQARRHSNLWWQSSAPDKKCSIKSIKGE